MLLDTQKSVLNHQDLSHVPNSATDDPAEIFHEFSTCPLIAIPLLNLKDNSKALR